MRTQPAGPPAGAGCAAPGAGRAPAHVESATGIVVRVRSESTRTRVTPVGELDLAAAPEFDRVLWDVQTQARCVLVDLRALVFIDAAGIRSLVGAQLRASSWRRELEVVCAGGQVRRMLALTGVDELLGVIAPIEPPTSPDGGRRGWTRRRDPRATTAAGRPPAARAA